MVSNHSDNFTELGSVIALLTDYHANGAYEKLKENVTLLDTENYAVMIRTTNFEANEFSKNLIYVDEGAYSFLRKSKVYPRDLIMNKIANPGTVYFMPDIGKPVSLGMNLFLIRLDESKVDPYFIYAFLRKNEHYVKSFASGSTTKTITKEDVRRLRVYCPPLAEQKKVAQILSTWDKAITTTEHLLANSQQQKKALMQQLLTGKKRLLDKNGVRFSGEWYERLLGDISKITTGSSNRQDSHLNGAYTFFDRSEDIRTSDSYLFDCEAVIVPGEGQDFVPKYFKGKFDLHQRTYAIMDFPQCDGRFLFYAIHFFRSHFLSHAVGSTVKSLRLPMFQKMKLNLPSFEEQQKIAKVLSLGDEEITALRHKLDALIQEKKALMQQLLTGKRRVKLND